MMRYLWKGRGGRFPDGAIETSFARRLTGLAIAVVVCAGSAAAQVSIEAKARLEGVVLDGDTDRPLSGVRVHLAEQTERRVTDDNGQFLFDALSAGSYVLRAEKSGYADARLDEMSIPGNTGIPLVIQPGQSLNGVLRLYPAARVSGRVLDSRGRPLRSAVITPFRNKFTDTGEPAFEHLESLTTDDRGEFRFHSLDPGKYGFRVAPLPRRLGEPVESTFYPFYYPGSAEAPSAGLVDLEAGSETRLLDMIVATASGGRLRVRTIDESGRTVEEARSILVRTRGETETVRSGRMDSRAAGEVGHLADGWYDIEVLSRSGRGVAPVEIFGRDTTVDVVVYPPATVTGRVFVESPQSNSPVEGVVVEFADDSRRLSQGVRTYSGTSDSDGTFVMTPMPRGSYRLRAVGIPGEMYILGIRQENRDVRRDGLQIEEQGTVDLTVSLAEGAGRIRGAVADADGRPVPGAIVALIPTEGRETHLSTATSADGNGAFTFESVAPGHYFLFSWRELNGAAYRNTTFMEAYSGRGYRVLVEERDAVDVALQALESER